MLAVDRLIDGLQTIRDGLIDASRLRALGVLAASTIALKLRHAQQFALLVEKAAALQSFLHRYYQCDDGVVSWTPEIRPDTQGLLPARSLSIERVEFSAGQVERSVALRTEELRHSVRQTKLLAPGGMLLDEVGSILPRVNATSAVENVKWNGRTDSAKGAQPERVLRGPREVGREPAFEPAYSLLEMEAPEFGEDIVEAVPYFWTLALRECVAAELCALCAVEYDGLPLDFYRDMGKQTWDEARHAEFFLSTAVRLLPELKATLSADSPLHGHLERFHSTSVGLPVPKEWNLYEAFLNATLTQRLVIMHLRTETPAIARISARLETSLCDVHPEIANGLQVDAYDETSHSRIGISWLRYLLPNSDKRREEIESTDMLEKVLLLTAFAEHGDCSLGELVERYSTEVAPGGAAPRKPSEGQGSR